MKTTVLLLAVVSLALGKPSPQGFGNPAPQGFGNPAPQGFGNPAPQGVGSPISATGGLPKRKLWLTIDDNSLEVFDPLNPRPTFKSNIDYSKVDGKAVAVPNYYFGSSEELFYNNPSTGYHKPQFKSQPFKIEGNHNLYYDYSGELNIVPDPSMVSPVHAQFYSNLPVEGPNAPRYYIDSSGELGVASDFFMSRLAKTDQDPNLYRDNSGELLYVYPKGTRPGSPSPSGPPPPAAAAALPSAGGSLPLFAP